MEKFLKNYFDAGTVVEEVAAQEEEDKHVQELEYYDGTIFRGEMEFEEDSQLMYKEGRG